MEVRLTEWSPDQLMFIDESAANERTLDCKYGWSSTQCVVMEELKKSKKWSILPVYTQGGYIAWDILHRSYTIELFNQFIETWVIPNSNPFPGPNSVSIMDNVKLHRNEVCMAIVHSNC